MSDGNRVCIHSHPLDLRLLVLPVLVLLALLLLLLALPPTPPPLAAAAPLLLLLLLLPPPGRGGAPPSRPSGLVARLVHMHRVRHPLTELRSDWLDVGQVLEDGHAELRSTEAARASGGGLSREQQLSEGRGTQAESGRRAEKESGPREAKLSVSTSFTLHTPAYHPHHPHHSKKQSAL